MFIDNLKKVSDSVNVINKFIYQDKQELSKIKKFHINHLSSESKNTLIKVENYLLDHPDSRLEFMPLPVDELHKLAGEILKSKKIQYKKPSKVESFINFLTRPFSFDAKILNQMKKISKINSTFNPSQGHFPECKVESSWKEMIDDILQGQEDTEKIENGIIDYFKSAETEPKEKEKNLGRLIQLAKVKVYDRESKGVIEKILNAIVKFSQDEMKEAGASLAEREAIRTPNEILISALSYLKKHPIGGNASEAIKQKFLQHTADIESTNKILEDIADKYKEKGQDAEAEYILNLKTQLPSSSSGLLLTRLHENIYGRVFETALTSYLVEHPPQEVSKAISLASHQLADLLEEIFSGDKNLYERRGILYRFRNFIEKNDTRFWFQHEDAMALTRIGKLDDHKKIYEELIDYLRMEKKSGIEIISLSYTLVKLIVLVEQYQRKNQLSLLPWIDRTQANYRLIVGETSRKKIGDKVKTEGAGITLPHQPSAKKEEWMSLSERPSTYYQLQMGQASQSARTALKHGVPWAGGVSGSTNVSLFTMQYFNKKKGVNIDAVSYLLGVMMFLTYDGGHSMHEAMWTANQLDWQLNLGLNLSDEGSDPKDFVSDYVAFKEKLKGDEAIKFQEAIDAAWEKVVEYYDEHSYFSS